eukprot:14477051-Ditylum_brightwellii.AAC.1
MAVESEGLTTLEEVGLEEDGCGHWGDLPKLVILITSKIKLLGLHKWTKTQQRYRNALAATNFTATVCNAYVQKVRDEIEDEEEDDDDLAKLPRQLSANDKWPMYKKLIANWLDTKKGMEGAPLSYVIKKYDAAITNMSELVALKTNHKRLIKGTEISGTAYDTNNGNIFHSSRDFALKALDKHFQGDARIGKSKDEAYAAIKADAYTGSCPKHYS